ncbi:hypothetical protein PTKIN_Ptkin01aG0128200 [Pterospermum kingtungense]
MILLHHCLSRKTPHGTVPISYPLREFGGCGDGLLDLRCILPVRNIHGDNLEYFQKHCGKGHPVIVRNVLQKTSDLSWDQIFLFCSYLKNSVAKAENKELTKATGCLDWFEVEIGIKQLFLGSLRGLTQSNMCDEKLKLKGWLSSHLFQEQFADHYAEIIRALPLPEYMDPRSGLLNIAARLQQEITKPDLGPCVYLILQW